MSAWIWILLGLALLAAELLTPGGFFLLFFGAAALVVAALTGIGALAGATAQWSTFGVLGTILLLALRPTVRRFAEGRRGHTVDDLRKDIASVTEAIAPGTRGKVELRGAAWTARNEGTVPLEPGDRARVLRVDGLTLIVEKEG